MFIKKRFYIVFIFILTILLCQFSLAYQEINSSIFVHPSNNLIGENRYNNNLVLEGASNNFLSDSSIFVHPSNNLIGENRYNNNLVSGSYIIEFKDAPLVKERLDLKGKSSLIQSQDARNRFDNLKNKQSDAIIDISNRINSQDVSLSPETGILRLPFFDPIYELLSKITGKVVNNPNENSLDITYEYYNSFNGVSINRLSVGDIAKIRASPYVKNIYPNLFVHASLTDSLEQIDAINISKYDSNFNLCAQSNLPCLTGQGIKVAILDTGVDYTHPDLGGCLGPGCKVAGGYDFINNDSDPMDDHYHGTHVAGIISANGKIKGVAPNSTLYSYKVLDSEGSGSIAQILAGIDMAIDPNQDGDFSDKADIISMSLGVDCSYYYGEYNSLCGPNDAISRAIDYAVDIGSVAVIAGGNSGENGERSIGSPGTARNAITVAASSNNIQRDSTLFINGILYNSSAFLRSKIVENLTGELEVAPANGTLIRSNITKNFEFASGNLSGKFVLVSAGDFITDYIIDESIHAGVKGIILFNTDSNFISNSLSSIKNVTIISIDNLTAYNLISRKNNSENITIKLTIKKNYSFTDDIAYFSSIGPVMDGDEILLKPDISAPGYGIVSTMPGNSYYELSGTSMATPHVAGVVALLKQAKPDISAYEVKSILMNNAENVNNLPYLIQGTGKVNVTKIIRSKILPINKIFTNGRVGDNFIFSAEVNSQNIDSNISLYYGSGVEPKTWINILLTSQDITGSNLSKQINSLHMKDGYYTFKLRVFGNGTNTESRSLIYVNNNEIRNISSFEINKIGNVIPINLKINALNESTGYFIGYKIFYSRLDDALYNENTLGLEICNSKVGKEQVSYNLANSQICDTLNVDDRVFLWDTKYLSSKGMYSLILRTYYSDHTDEEQISYIYLDDKLRGGFPKDIFFENGSNYAGYLTPLVNDLDGDGKKEIIVNIGRNGPNAYSTIRVYREDGEIFWQKEVGFEINNDSILGTSAYQLPVIADLDGDGKKEILIYISNYYSFDEGGRLYALNSSGEIVSGFPIKLPNDGLPRLLAHDFDNDGKDEVIVQGNTGAFSGSFVAVIKNGTLYKNWSLPPSGLANPYLFPTVVNFDSDSDSEFAVFDVAKTAGGDWGLFSTILVYNIDGSFVTGWPKNITESLWFSTNPSSGDLNGDGKDELIFPVYYPNNTHGVISYNYDGSRGNFSFNVTGRLLPMPYNYTLVPTISTSITISDLNKDGKQDVLFGSWGSYLTGNDIYAVYNNGSLVSGWPRNISVLGGTNLFENNEVTVSDVDNDGNNDILISGGSAFPIYGYNPPIVSLNGGVYAWHLNGSLVSGFPYATGYYASTAPVITDLDGDGKLELIASSNYGYGIGESLLNISRNYFLKNKGSLYVWNLSSSFPVTSSINPKELDGLWLSHRKDSSFTGCANCSRDDFNVSYGRKINKDLYSNFTLEVVNVVRVVFNGTINISRLNESYLEDNIQILSNFVSIDISKLSEFNIPAEITFFNVKMSDPLVKYNAGACPESICTYSNYDQSSGKFILKVNSFSTFALFENIISPVKINSGGGGGGGSRSNILIKNDSITSITNNSFDGGKISIPLDNDKNYTNNPKDKKLNSVSVGLIMIFLLIGGVLFLILAILIIYNISKKLSKKESFDKFDDIKYIQDLIQEGNIQIGLGDVAKSTETYYKAKKIIEEKNINNPALLTEIIDLYNRIMNKKI